jgi:hypothetical protein
MTQRIKNKANLPAWFDLEKYQLANTLNAAGWYVQLSIRKRCLSYVSQGDDLSEILNRIRAAPIIDITKHDMLSFHFHSGMFYEQPVIEQSIHGFHSLTVHELYMAGINIEESKRTQARTFYDEIFCAPENPREPPLIKGKKMAFLYEPVHRVSSTTPDNALLGINLLLPDKELIEQFKTFLPVLRKECGASLFSAKWRKPDFSEWARLGVLPYLDLMIWEKEHDVKILNNVMEEAIFSSRQGSEDRIRKTTAPKAEELISKKSLALLRAQAKREQREQSTG